MPWAAVAEVKVSLVTRGQVEHLGLLYGIGRAMGLWEEAGEHQHRLIVLQFLLIFLLKRSQYRCKKRCLPFHIRLVI